MKRILLSVGTIAVVAGLAIGGTMAFYNDTETSSGNIFVAGSIDLKVDHERQTYNGIDCQTCSLEIFSSDGQNYVTDATENAVFTGGPLPKLAVEVSNPHNNWVDHTELDYKWVWVDESTSASDAGNQDVEYTFERDFQWNGVIGDITFEMALASDNGYAIYVNDVLLVDNLDDEVNYNATIQPLDTLETEFKDALQLGNNTLKIIVRNHAQSGGTPASNPGGLLYYLSIEDEDCQNNVGFQNACRLWTEKDLEDGDTFFNFGDIKPHDEGTNLISLHVDTNEAFICLLPNNIVDDENDVVDPEVEAGDDENDTGIPFGELSQEIEFFGWADDGNGTYEDGEEVLIPAGTALIDIQTEMIEMTLDPETTGYVGLAWCAGEQTGPQSTSDPVALSCDGAGMSNIAQTDSVEAQLVAYAEQTRNNEGFSCEDVDLDGEEEPQ